MDACRCDDHVSASEAAFACEDVDVLDGQFILEDAPAVALVSTVTGAAVTATRLRHRDHAVRREHSIQLEQELPLVGDVVKRIVYDHLIAGGIPHRKTVTVIRHELWRQVPSGAWILAKTAFPDREG